MPAFFPMRRGDLAYLAALAIATALCFLPAWRDIHLAGMALTGWLLAALMVLSPAIALARIAAERRDDRSRP